MVSDIIPVAPVAPVAPVKKPIREKKGRNVTLAYVGESGATGATGATPSLAAAFAAACATMLRAEVESAGSVVRQKQLALIAKSLDRATGPNQAEDGALATLANCAARVGELIPYAGSQARAARLTMLATVMHLTMFGQCHFPPARAVTA